MCSLLPGYHFLPFLLICDVFSEHEKLGPYYLRCSHLFCSALVEDEVVSELTAHISEKQIYWLKYSISSQFEKPVIYFVLNQYLNCDHCSCILPFIFFPREENLQKSIPTQTRGCFTLFITFPQNFKNTLFIQQVCLEIKFGKIVFNK